MIYGATRRRPVTPWRSIRRATSPLALASSTKLPRKAAPARLVDCGAHRLPDGREATVEDPCAAKFVGVRDQTGPEAGERIEILVHEELEGGCETLRAHQLGVLEMARQVEVVGAPVRHRDADTGAVDVVDRIEGAALGNHVSRLDLDIGGRERDRLRSRGFRGDEADVPDIPSRRIGELSGRSEGDVGD